MLDSITARSRIPDRLTLSLYGALAAGMIAGFGFGVALTMSLTPPPQSAPAAAVLCEFPAPQEAPQGDGIGFRILLDTAKRMGAAAHA